MNCPSAVGTEESGPGGCRGRPTGKVVLGLTLALLIALAIIEFLGRPSPREGEVSNLSG
jgi:hypothetical protein